MVESIKYNPVEMKKKKKVKVEDLPELIQVK